MKREQERINRPTGDGVDGTGIPNAGTKGEPGREAVPARNLPGTEESRAESGKRRHREGSSVEKEGVGVTPCLSNNQ